MPMQSKLDKTLNIIQSKRTVDGYIVTYSSGQQYPKKQTTTTTQNTSTCFIYNGLNEQPEIRM